MVIAVADYQTSAVLIEMIGELLDIGGDFGPQRRCQHMSGAVADDLIQQRPTNPTTILVGGFSVVNYLEHGRTFPTSAPPPVLIDYLIP